MRLHIFTVAASSHYNRQTQQQQKIKQPVIPHRVNSWPSKPSRKRQSRASGPLMINTTSLFPLCQQERFSSTARTPNFVTFLFVWDLKSLIGRGRFDCLRRRWMPPLSLLWNVPKVTKRAVCQHADHRHGCFWVLHMCNWLYWGELRGC